MKQFVPVKRETLFKGKYLYKLHFNFDCKEVNNEVIWLNPNHKNIMDNIKREVQTRFKNMFKIYKNIIYCQNLDVAFYIVIKNWERIKLIEKADVYEPSNEGENIVTNL